MRSSDDSTPAEQRPRPDGHVGYAYLVSAIAAVGGLLFGFDTAIISGAIEFVKAEFALNEHQEGFAVSSILIGCIIGAAMAGAISDRLGRKRVLIATAVIYMFSAILSGLPQTLQHLVLARFLGGLAVGVSSMVSPMYIAEIAPPHIRGRLVSLNQMAIVTGILMAYCVNWLLVDVGDNNWRWMFASESVPAFILLIGLFFVPESPRWLAKQDRHDDALTVLARVNGTGRAMQELGEIKQALAEEEGTLRELLQPGLRMALIISVTLAVLGQISGINTIIYYAPKIFLAAGFAEAKSALWATILVGTTNFVITIVSLWIIDKVGRKPLLLIGTAGMGIAMTLAGGLLASGAVPTALKVAIVLTYIASFGLGVGGVVWVVIAEIFPTKIRGRAVSIATASVWVACFAVAQTFPYLLGRFNERVFFIYAFLCLAMFLFVRFAVTETKGKSLEEIEKMWRGRTRGFPVETLRGDAKKGSG